LRTVSTRHARLKRNQLADPAPVDAVADVDHRSGGLVADDHRVAHHIVADTTMLVVVHIGTADPDGSNFDQDLTAGRFRDRTVLDPHIVGSVQHGTGVQHRRLLRPVEGSRRLGTDAAKANMTPLLPKPRYGC
jgi:hypothetical protein